MRFQYFLSLSAIVLTPVHAVTFSDFPQCAQECQSSSAAQVGGSLNDLKFVCTSSAFLDAVHACEAKTCSPSDLSRIFFLGIQLCEPVGGTPAFSLANLPSCAQPGLAFATTESGCSITDWTCICTSSAYTIIAAEYEEQYCSPADRQAILNYTSTACAAVGVQLQPPAPNAPYGRPSTASSSLAPTSSAQSVYGFPRCAQPCVDAALLQSGCQPSDWACICVNPAFEFDPIGFCASQSCSIDDQSKIHNIGSAQCAAFRAVVVPATTTLALPSGSGQSSPPLFSNLPQCAQFCATNATTRSGGSVADLNLLCLNGAVLVSIGACESALCSPTDQQTSVAISQNICAAVGGVASINPTVNPSAQPSVVSAAYATTTVVASLDDVPPCAKPCLVTAFRESGCFLDDSHCQCTSIAFRRLFTECQAAVCGILDLQRLLPFTEKRCSSIGIPIPSSVLSIESDIAYQIPTSKYTLPTPTDLNNAPIDVADLPSCAQECIYSAASFASCDVHNRTCLCTSETFSAYVSTCQTVACTADELQVITAYATALCQPVPGHLSANPTGALLSSYLAIPTYTAPNPSSITNAPNNISALPYCAQPCLYSAAAAANCSSINDLTCICKDPTFLSIIGKCDEANCDEAEQENIIALSEKLCKPAGGVAVSFTVNSTLATSTGRSPPNVTSFTGDATKMRLRVWTYVAGAFMLLFWAL